MKTSVKVEAGGDTEMGNLVKVEEDMDVDDKQLGMLKGVVDAALLGYVAALLFFPISGEMGFSNASSCRLRDRDDDVRSAAAATLSPITEAFVNRLPAELELIVGVLWECLGDLKDDLSSSIGGVMNLLGECLISTLEWRLQLFTLRFRDFSQVARFSDSFDPDAVSCLRVSVATLLKTSTYLSSVDAGIPSPTSFLDYSPFSGTRFPQSDSLSSTQS